MKTNKIIYWTSTGLLSAMFLLSAFMYLSHNPALVENFQKIGFPVLFVNILGIAKLLGALALVNPWFPKLKEWAYAGFTFTLIGAIWVHAATHTPFIGPLVFLVVLGISYYFSERIKVTQASLRAA